MTINKETILKKRAVLALTIVSAVTAFFLYHLIGNLQFDYDFEKFFPDEDPETHFFQEHRNTFGTDNDFILLGIDHDGSVFDPIFLKEIKNLTAELNTLQFVDTVISPTNFSIPKRRLGVIGSKEIEYDNILNLKNLKEDSARIFESGRFVNTVFSENGNAISIFIKTKDYMTKVECEGVCKSIDETLSNYSFHGTHLAGRPIGQVYYINLMQNDLAFFLTASLILLLLILGISYKSVWGVVLPVLIVVIANIWILGFMAMLDVPINMILTILPTIVFVVVLSDIVHLTSKYLDELRLGKSKVDALKLAFREVGMATLLTSITTAIGFMALISSPVGPFQTFGLYTGISVLFSYILAFTIMPACFILMKKPRIVVRKGFWKPIMATCFLFTIRHPVKIIIASVILCTAAVVGVFQMSYDNYLLEDLTEGDPMRADYYFFSEEFSGVRPFELSLSVENSEHSVIDYEVAQELLKIEAFLRTEYGVGNLVSSNSLIKGIHQANNGGLIATYTFPENEAAYNKSKRILKRTVKKAQKGSQQSHKSSQKVLTILDTSLTKTRMYGRIGDWGSYKLNQLNQDFDTFFKANIDQTLLSYQFTGAAYLIDKNNSVLAIHIIKGLVLAIFLVALLMGLLFKSLRIVLISILPNLLPLLLIAGFWGVSDINFKITVSIVFTIAFGICVDDTIHFLSKFKIEKHKGSSFIYALKRSYLTTGKAIIITSLIICGGFFLLSFSDFMGTYLMGAFISATLLLALISDLFLLPALLLVFYKK